MVQSPAVSGPTWWHVPGSQRDTAASHWSLKGCIPGVGGAEPDEAPAHGWLWLYSRFFQGVSLIFTCFSHVFLRSVGSFPNYLGGWPDYPNDAEVRVVGQRSIERVKIGPLIPTILGSRFFSLLLSSEHLCSHHSAYNFWAHSSKF